MGIFDFFRSRSEDHSAKVAKDRLQVLIAHERTGRNGPDYLPMLKQDILNVIKKYVSVGEDQVSVQLDTQENCDVLELNITLPEDGDAKSDSKNESKRSGASNVGKQVGNQVGKKNEKNSVRNAGSLPASGVKKASSEKKSKGQFKVT